ncbi:MAG: hypothetical protein DRJ40_00540 [Thermoprotei archaeon]|nr:MAG: hypothetical protein DRJ40_00540 [Thermoprotei archaeon]
MTNVRVYEDKAKNGVVYRLYFGVSKSTVGILYRLLEEMRKMSVDQDKVVKLEEAIKFLTQE